MNMGSYCNANVVDDCGEHGKPWMSLSSFHGMSDLPTHLYLTLFVWKWAGRTDAHMYFLEYDL